MAAPAAVRRKSCCGYRLLGRVCTVDEMAIIRRPDELWSYHCEHATTVLIVNLTCNSDDLSNPSGNGLKHAVVGRLKHGVLNIVLPLFAFHFEWSRTWSLALTLRMPSERVPHVSRPQLSGYVGRSAVISSCQEALLGFHRADE